MTISFEEYYKQDFEDDFEHPDEVAKGAILEYNNNEEIKNSFKSFYSYYKSLCNTVCQAERVEYYLIDSDGKRFGCIIIQGHMDIHYDVVAVASVLWIPSGYRGDPEVSKIIVSIFRKFCKDYEIKYYKRVSKITPYIHKHIVKEVK